MESFYHPRKGLEIDAKNIEFPDREEGKQHHVFQADKKVNKGEFCSSSQKPTYRLFPGFGPKLVKFVVLWSSNAIIDITNWKLIFHNFD